MKMMMQIDRYYLIEFLDEAIQYRSLDREGWAG